LKRGKLFALERPLRHETQEMVKIYPRITDQDAEEEKREFAGPTTLLSRRERSNAAI
jgi:hypothetical protein